MIDLTSLMRLLFATVAGSFVLVGYRWICGRSIALGHLVGAAILLRVLAGAALFWISYLQLPIATALQRGGGFWMPALDATGYYQLAAQAADAGRLFPLDHAIPSPVYVNSLAVFMMVVGVSPATGALMNLLLYVVLCLAVAWCHRLRDNWREDLPCLVCVAAYSFSPVVLFNSTQPLKDELFCTLMALACLAAVSLRRLVHGATGRGAYAGLVVGVVALFGITGIRWYSALIIWCALAVVLVAYAIRGRTVALPQYARRSVVVLVTLWLPFWYASGPYYRTVIPNGQGIVTVPARLLRTTQILRHGFLASGGNSNVVVALRSNSAVGNQHADALAAVRREEAPKPPPASPAEARRVATDRYSDEPREVNARAETQQRVGRATPVTAIEQTRTMLTGLAVLFVPMNVLQPALGIRFSSGRSMLLFADLDTVFMDATILMILLLLWKRRETIRDRWPSVTFWLILATANAVPLGYIVTNFGTLWRLRTIVAIPLWMAAAALAGRPEDEDPATQRAADAGVPALGWR